MLQCLSSMSVCWITPCKCLLNLFVPLRAEEDPSDGSGEPGENTEGDRYYSFGQNLLCIHIYTKQVFHFSILRLSQLDVRLPANILYLIFLYMYANRYPLLYCEFKQFVHGH